MQFSLSTLPIAFLCVMSSLALTLDENDKTSICDAVGACVRGAMEYYEGLRYGGVVGTFQQPYYWWHAGEVFGSWVDYWYYCQKDNETFEQILFDAMYHQRGENNDYIPSNQSMTEGNDDQGVWGMALMQAVERNFTNGEHSWILMTQTLFNTMNNRWDTSSCGGGLRWQIFTWNNGYNYKNSIANGCLFHLAARLYRFTEQEIYLEVCDKVYQWMWDVGFFSYNPDFVIFDGATDTNNCTELTVHKWSYSYGIFLSGAAYLYNATSDQKWLDSASTILNASSFFFVNNIMTETSCQEAKVCNNDQRSFRSLFARCLGLTANLIPDFYDQIVNGYLKPSAQGAAASCSGEGKDTCGQDWSLGEWDGFIGLGEQIASAETIIALLTTWRGEAPLTPQSGGSLDGANVDAGNGTIVNTNEQEIDVTKSDKTGAAILTAVVLSVLLGCAIWIVL